MLLWTSLLCLFSANLVASQFFPPEIFAGYDPRSVFRPLNDGLVSKRSPGDPRVIRALLAVRQTECPADTTACANEPLRLVAHLSLVSLVAFYTPFGRGHLFAASRRWARLVEVYTQKWDYFAQVLPNQRYLLLPRW